MTESDPFELVSLNNQGGVSVIPLGGLGEIGMNCMVYEYDGQIMVVDCGVNFPATRDYGVDVETPSFSYLLANADRVAGVVITHGHEDHIGAIPHLLRDLNPPIYAPPMALELIKNKLRDHGLYEHAQLHETRAGDTVEVGPFEVEFIHVNHSMPHTCALAIRTPVGVLIHTGDYKIDHTPVEEAPIDLARFAVLGQEGVLGMMGDSTNAVVAGSAGSEGWLAEQLEQLIETAPGRVLITMFASNLYRLQGLLDIAHDVGRRVLILGRSLRQNVEVGRRLGILRLPNENILIDQSSIDAFRHDQLLVIMTGSQGEPRSALTRIAMNDHPWFSVLPGDYVIFSARVIPGNERGVSRLTNHLCRRGARVFNAREHPVHVSGHAKVNELQLMLALVQPEVFIPVHGEYRHLARHIEMAERLGVQQTILAENGDVVTFWKDGAERTGRVHAGKMLVAGKGTDAFPSMAIRNRRKLARTGMVVAWLVLDTTSGDVVSGPKLLTQGIMPAQDDERLLQSATESALAAVEDLNLESRREAAEVAEAVRRAVRRVFNRHMEQKPVVVPIVHEL